MTPCTRTFNIALLKADCGVIVEQLQTAAHEDLPYGAGMQSGCKVCMSQKLSELCVCV